MTTPPPPRPRPAGGHKAPPDAQEYPPELLALFDGMTARQRRFCFEYPKDLNGTQAAIRAGFAPKSARQQANRLITDAAIQDALALIGRQVERECIIDAADIINELAGIAFTNMGEVAAWEPLIGVTLVRSAELEPEVLAAIKEVSTRAGQFGLSTSIKLHDKVRALELLARHYHLAAGEQRHTITLELGEEDESI